MLNGVAKVGMQDPETSPMFDVLEAFGRNRV